MRNDGGVFVLLALTLALTFGLVLVNLAVVYAAARPFCERVPLC